MLVWIQGVDRRRLRVHHQRAADRAGSATWRKQFPADFHCFQATVYPLLRHILLRCIPRAPRRRKQPYFASA